MKVAVRDLALALLVAGGITSLRAQQAPVPIVPAAPAAPVVAVSATNAPGPKIKFAEPVFDFGRIRSGEVVKHSYSFTNVGDQVLEVQNVQPSCGCTAAAEWSKRVEVGQSGSIPIQFNSASFSGPVFKTVTVVCNDKSQPTTVLPLKGTIWKPIEVAPQFAVLNVPPDAPGASTIVRIINNMEEPITVSAPESNQRAFTAELSTNQPGKEFQLKISAVPPLTPGNVQGQITLKTSSTNMPVVMVTVWANVQPALAIMPPQIMLPHPPLASKTLPTVTIQNNSTNTVTLSEAAVNLQGVDVTLQELQPGRAFSVTLAFPQGFALPAGQSAELTAKTTNPQFPLIKVPIMQMPRPVVAAPAPSPVVPSLAPPPPAPPPPSVAH